VNEAVHLAAKDIHSARHQIHVRFGKGGKERFTILSDQCLDMLRNYWRQSTECKKDYLFPGQDPTQPITPSSVRKVLKAAKLKIGMHERIRVHSLRHYAASRIMPNEFLHNALSSAFSRIG
jgi:site-specific recombinase XerD